MENENKLRFEDAIIEFIKNSTKTIEKLLDEKCPYKNWIIGYGSEVKLYKNKKYSEIRKIFENLNVRIEYGKMKRKVHGYYCDLEEYYCMESIRGIAYCYFMPINQEE